MRLLLRTSGGSNPGSHDLRVCSWVRCGSERTSVNDNKKGRPSLDGLPLSFVCLDPELKRVGEQVSEPAGFLAGYLPFGFKGLGWLCLRRRVLHDSRGRQTQVRLISMSSSSRVTGTWYSPSCSSWSLGR